MSFLDMLPDMSKMGEQVGAFVNGAQTLLESISVRLDTALTELAAVKAAQETLAAEHRALHEKHDALLGMLSELEQDDIETAAEAVETAAEAVETVAEALETVAETAEEVVEETPEPEAVPESPPEPEPETLPEARKEKETLTEVPIPPEPEPEKPKRARRTFGRI